MDCPNIENDPSNRYEEGHLENETEILNQWLGC